MDGPMLPGLQGQDKDVDATFKFLQWLPLYEKEKPFELLVDLPPRCADARRTNIVFKTANSKQRIQSVRGRESEFHLDVHGFALRNHKTPFVNWLSRVEVERLYVPEMERLVQREVEGADRVFTYDWRVCKPMDTHENKALIVTKLTSIIPA